MIGRLQGRLLSRQPPWLLLDVAGVGYEIEAPMSTFYRLPAVGESAVLHTHLVVREDAHLLFGFSAEDERALFRTLIRVSGIGPRVALAVLSGISVSAFWQAVQAGDATLLTRLPGIGRKTADRLLIETDSPYLAPMPHRGKTNEPAYVAYVAEYLAELRGVDASELAAQTSENFTQLFLQ